MSRYLMYTLIVVLGACSGNLSATVDTDADMVDVQYLRLHALEGSQKNISMWTVRSTLEEVYRQPISFEWPFVQDDRTTEDEPLVSFDFSPDNSFGESLNSLVAASCERLKWEHFKDSIVICPAGEPKGSENNMDVCISLHVSSVSTWDALKEAAAQANRANPNERPLEISPEFLGRGYRAPDGFSDEPAITLSLDSVTVREAVCAIFAQSPLVMSYGYRNYFYPATGGPFSRLTVRCLTHKDQSKNRRENVREMMTSEEVQRWNGEVQRIVDLARTKE